MGKKHVNQSKCFFQILTGRLIKILPCTTAEYNIVFFHANTSLHIIKYKFKALTFSILKIPITALFKLHDSDFGDELKNSPFFSCNSIHKS